jgi:hypothetical protein
MPFDPSTAQVYDPDKPISVTGKGFDPTTAKPVTPKATKSEIPSVAEPAKEPGLIDRLGKVVESGGYGAAAGAFAPELVTGLGYGMMAFPPTAPFAPPVIGAGRLMRAAGFIPRLGYAGEGAVAGAGGETLKQTAEVAGASPAVQAGAEIVGSMSGPGVMKFMGYQVGRLLGMDKTLVNQAVGRLSSQAAETGAITESQKEQLQRVAGQIKGKATQKDIEDLYNILKKGAGEIEAGGKKAMTEAETEAQRITSAAGRAGTMSEQQVAKAQATKQTIGEPKELSDIGNTLREDIVTKNKDLLEKRSADYKNLESARDKVLAEKEAAGEFIENTPEYKALVKELDAVLNPKGRSALQTDPGVLRAFQDLKTAITPQTQVLSETEAKEMAAQGITVLQGKRPSTELINGVPTQVEKEFLYRKVPPSFGAIDTVRRRLGDAAFGKEAEGYAALKGNIAQDFYFKLSKLQSDFAGETQTALQNSYKESSGWLDKFKAQLGKKVTAIDRFDETKFATDPQSLPNSFFKSQQSVKDLKELTTPELVNKAASDFVASNIGNTAAEAQKFKKQYSEMLREIPELSKKVDGYIRNLETAELGVARGKEVAGMAKTKAESIMTKGKEQLTAAENKAKLILGDQFPVDRMKSIILSGDPKLWAEVGPIIAKEPQGKELFAKALSAALGQETSGLVLTKPGSIGAIFEDRIAPAIRGAGLMDEQKIGLLKKQIDNIYQTPKTAQAKLNSAQTAIIRAIQGGAATGATALTDTLFGLHRTGE